MRRASLLFLPLLGAYLFGVFLLMSLFDRIAQDVLTTHDAIGFAAGLIECALILFLCFDKLRESVRDDEETLWFREDLG